MTTPASHWRARTIPSPRRPLIMGIVNINDDSFCGDGTLHPEAALQQALSMARAGADIIDVGAESARTNRDAITTDAEVARLTPFIIAWEKAAAQLAAEPAPTTDQLWPPALSINTWRGESIAQLLPLGGDLLNDMSGLPDATNAQLAAQHRSGLLIMHTRGQPKVPHTHIHYPDIITTLQDYFAEKIHLAHQAGVPPHSIILDPGLDFAKQTPDNLTILRHLTDCLPPGDPILLPLSRKTFIGHTLHQPDPLQRDPGTLACIAHAMHHSPHTPIIFRVHHVPAALAAVRLIHTLRTSSTA